MERNADQKLSWWAEAGQVESTSLTPDLEYNLNTFVRSTQPCLLREGACGSGPCKHLLKDLFVLLDPQALCSHEQGNTRRSFSDGSYDISSDPAFCIHDPRLICHSTHETTSHLFETAMWSAGIVDGREGRCWSSIHSELNSVTQLSPCQA